MSQFLEGYNATILAYGQTGSGKTYTMGTSFTASDQPENLGIIPRLLEEVLDQVEELKEQYPNMRFSLSASYLEIYNEHIRDLLAPSEEHDTRKTYMMTADEFGNYNPKGLTEQPITQVDHLADYLAQGAQRRTTAATNMNDVSSRSHAVFTLKLDQTPVNKSDNSEESIGKTSLFRLVDLAGSERSKKSGAEGDRLREANNINKSLTTLGMCINKLASKEKHIPYRSSKLTHLLQNSLGGNSSTLMIACVSPSDLSFEETMLTLRYADTASSIENKPVVNADPHATTNVALRSAVSELTGELSRVYAQGAAISDNILQKYQIVGNSVPFSSPVVNKTKTQNFTDEKPGTTRQRLFNVPDEDKRPEAPVFPKRGDGQHENTKQLKDRISELEYELAHSNNNLSRTKTKLSEIAQQGSNAYEQLTKLYAENAKLLNERDKWNWRFHRLHDAVAKELHKNAVSLFSEESASPDDLNSALFSDEKENFNLIEQKNNEIEKLKYELREKTGDEKMENNGEHTEYEDDEDEGESKHESQDEEENHDDDTAAEVAEAAADFSLEHMEHQAHLKGKLDEISSLLQEKERLYRISVANATADKEENLNSENYSDMKTNLEGQLTKSEQEIRHLENKVDELSKELESARCKQQKNKDSSSSTKEKDVEIRSLEKKIKEMQHNMEETKREQRRKEREVERLQKLKTEIEQHKREKVELEKRIRETARRYQQDKKEKEREAAKLAKENRKAQLEIAKQKTQLEKQDAQLRAVRQRERTRTKTAACRDSKRTVANSVRSQSGFRHDDSEHKTDESDITITGFGSNFGITSSQESSRMFHRVNASNSSAPEVTEWALLGDTNILNERAAKLVRETVHQLQPINSEFEQTEAIFLGENGEKSVLTESGVLPQQIQDIMIRTIYYRNQKLVWKQRADEAVEKRAKAAERVCELETQLENTNDLEEAEELRHQIDYAKRELASLTIEIQQAHAQRLSFEQDEEREGLKRNGWMARVMDEASRMQVYSKGKRKGMTARARSDLAGRLLNWFMMNIMKYNVALHGEGEDGIRRGGIMGSISKLKQQIRELQEENSRLRADVQRADTRLTATLLQTSMDYESRITGLRSKIRQLEKQVTSDSQDNTEASVSDSALQEQTNVNNQLADQVEKLTEEMKELQEKYDQAVKQNRRMKKQLSAPRSLKRIQFGNANDKFSENSIAGSLPQRDDALVSGHKRESTDSSSDLDTDENKRQRSGSVEDVATAYSRRQTDGDDAEEHDDAGGIDCLPSMDEIHKAVENSTDKPPAKSVEKEQSITLEDVGEDEFDTSEDAKQRFKNECLDRNGNQNDDIRQSQLVPRSSVFQTTEASRAKIQNKREKAGYRTKSAFGTTIFVESEMGDEELLEEHHGHHDNEAHELHRKSAYVSRSRRIQPGHHNEAAQNVVASTNAAVANVLKDMEAVKKKDQASMTLRKARAIQRVAKRNAALLQTDEDADTKMENKEFDESDLVEQENSFANDSATTTTPLPKSADPPKHRVSNGDEFSRRILQSKTNQKQNDD